jgi:hypothetical protein
VEATFQKRECGKVIASTKDSNRYSNSNVYQVSSPRCVANLKYNCGSAPKAVNFGPGVNFGPLGANFDPHGQTFGPMGKFWPLGVTFGLKGCMFAPGSV